MIRTLHKLSPRQWLNILWTMVFLVYAVVLAFFTLSGQVQDFWSGDFKAFYATAQIALTKGISQVYNLQLQSQYQQALPGTPPGGFVLTPMPYLPVFVLLFLPLAIFNFLTSYWAWILLNVVLFIGYLYRFTKALGDENGRDLLFKLVMCIPVFSNFFLGQVNVFLLIFLGEFFLAALKGKDRLSGIWLSGLLLKPQVLILILPGLLLSKRYKALAGFGLGSLVLFTLSLVLVGPQSMAGLGLLLLGYVHGLPSNSPEVMMNWRSLAMNLSTVMPGIVAWIIALEGMVLTVMVTLSLWRPPLDSTSDKYALLLLGTFAGTLSVTWHAHNHMELLLFPFIIYLYARKYLPWKVLYIWLLLPPVYLAVIFLITPQNAYGLFGLGNLAVNLILLGWTARSLHSRPRLADVAV